MVILHIDAKLCNIMMYFWNIITRGEKLMIHKTVICFLILLIASTFIILMGYDPTPTPKAQNDNSEIILDQTIASIKSGLPFAIKRVDKWRDTMHLNYINVAFIGKEQIKKRKGTVSYFFYEENVTKKLDADAFVIINMNADSIVGFRSNYGTRKELGGGAEELNTDNWIIDINEAFDIALTKLGEDNILQYDNPKVVIRCSESVWEFVVYSSPESSYQDFLVKINPDNGNVLG